MRRLAFCLVTSCLLSIPPAMAKDTFEAMPAAIAAVARDLDKECKAQGLGHVIKSDNYGLIDREFADFDHDGKRDYIVYNCMFGCSEKPGAFTGTGSPCPWGSLLLSGELRGKRLFVPGVVNRIYDGKPLTMVITRPKTLRLEGNYCSDRQPATDPQHLYKLEGGKILLVDKCPEGGCQSLAANFAAPQQNLAPLPIE